MQILSDLSLGM